MQTTSVFAHAGLIIVNREILGAAYVQQLHWEMLASL